MFFRNLFHPVEPAECHRKRSNINEPPKTKKVEKDCHTCSCNFDNTPHNQLFINGDRYDFGPQVGDEDALTMRASSFCDNKEMMETIYSKNTCGDESTYGILISVDKSANSNVGIRDITVFDHEGHVLADQDDIGFIAATFNDFTRDQVLSHLDFLSAKLRERNNQLFYRDDD